MSGPTPHPPPPECIDRLTLTIMAAATPRQPCTRWLRWSDKFSMYTVCLECADAAESDVVLGGTAAVCYICDCVLEAPCTAS